jgi:hypothetical protein
MVTIEVGPEKEHFVVHQSFLCAKSPYFDKALSGSFQEAITRLIRLPDTSPILFRIFVAWLYHGLLHYLPPHGRTVDQDFESLTINQETLEQEVTHQYMTQDDLDVERSDSDDSDDDAIKTPSGPVVVNNPGIDTIPTPKLIETSKPPTSGNAKHEGDATETAAVKVHPQHFYYI